MSSTTTFQPQAAAPRYTGDRIAIGGDYQFNAVSSGIAPQRFWHEAKLREAQRWADPHSGDVIVDVGCGSGVLAWRMAQIAGTRVIGVDGNKAAIEFATRQFRRENLEYRLGLVDEIGLPDQSVSKITFLEVIEHVHEWQALQVLRCFHRILKPGGRAVISTPNYASLWPAIEWLMDALKLAPHLADDQHVAFYTARSLAALGAKAGLKLVAHRTVNFAAPWVAMLSWKAAEFVHRLETRRSQPLGSLLLMSFEKPIGEGRAS